MPQDKRVFIDGSGGARKGGMEKDIEDRYIPNGYYKDARNVDFMVNGSQFILSNVKGNTQVPYGLNTGSNTVIGSFDDKAAETVYVFIFNGDGNHEIIKYQYNLTVDTVTQLAEGVGLAFDFQKLITGIIVVQGRYLVWAQEDQEIGCIDLNNTPTSEAITITAANRWRVELYKVPNPIPLEPKYCTVLSRDTNRLTGKLYKFRTRYIYEGGFRTHASTVSKLAIPEYGYKLTDDSEAFDNQIHMDVPLPENDKVIKVELLVQSGSNDNAMGNWFKFKEITYDEIDSNINDVVTITFNGDETLEVVDQTEINLPFSFIPPSCKEVVMLPSNVLAFLNIKEGFDSDVEVRGQVYPTYNTRSFTSPAVQVTVSSLSSSSSISGSFYNANFDILLDTGLNYKSITIGGTARYGNEIQLDIVVSHSGTSPVTFANKTVSILYPIKNDDTLSTIASNIASIINSTDTRYLGFGGIIAYTVGTQIRLVYGVNQENDPYTPSSNVVSVSSTLTSGTFSGLQTQPTFKRWRNHNFAIQYNKNGRRSSAIPLGSFYSEGYDATTNDFFTTATAVIESDPPADADSFDILYSKNSPEFLQLWVNIYRVVEVPYSEGTGSRPAIGQTVDQSTNIGRVVSYIDGDSIEGTIRIAIVSGAFSAGTITYNTSTWSATCGDEVYNNMAAVDLYNRIDYDLDTYGYKSLNFNFVEGDQIRLIGEGTSITYFTDIVSVPINEVTSNFAFFNYDLTSLDPAIENSEVAFIEVFRPSLVDAPVIYSEIGHHYDIVGGFHQGNVQNQTASVGAIIDLTGVGSSYELFAKGVGDSFRLLESNDASPQYESAVTAIGRPNVVTESGLNEINRSGSIAFSQPIVPDSNTNGLSIVLGTSIVTKYEGQFGSIQKASLRQNRELVVYFEDKVGAVGVFSDLRKGTDSNVSYNTSALLNEINFYAYDGGIGLNPESFSYYNTTHYFVSPKNNAVCRLSNNGIEEISDYGMTSWFNDNLDVKNKYIESLRAYGAFDERNDSYMVSFVARVTLEVLVSSNPVGTFLGYPDFPIFNDNPFEVGTKIIEMTSVGDVITQTITSSTDIGGGVYDVTFQSGDPVDASSTYDYLISSGTLAFNEPANGWTSFQDFVPENMVTCGVDFLSFKEGGIWVHNQNETRGNFYGTQFDAEVEIPFNANPAQMKCFTNIQQDSESAWNSATSGDISTPEGQSSTLLDTDYVQFFRERFSAGLLKDELTPNLTYPLLEGDDLRSYLLNIRLRNSSTTQTKLSAVTVTSHGSNLSL